MALAQANQATHVLIAGRGPAGLAAAIALAERGIEVLTLAPATPIPALSRAEMLPGAARAILQRLGVGDILTQSVTLQGLRQNWKGSHLELHEALPAAALPVGWSLDRRALHSALQDRAAALGVTSVQGRLRRISGAPGQWNVHLSDGSKLTARLLIDATGRAAALARRLGAKTQQGPPLLARVWTDPGAAPPFLEVEAQAAGWRYSLPHPAGGTSIGWLAQAETHQRQGAATAATAPLVDARNRRLSPLAGPGWLAVGDAALAFDPIASQGCFNALSGGFLAGNAAADACQGSPDNIAIYCLLAERTGQHTHQRIPGQYASRQDPHPFWQDRSRQTFAAR